MEKDNLNSTTTDYTAVDTKELSKQILSKQKRLWYLDNREYINYTNKLRSMINHRKKKIPKLIQQLETYPEEIKQLQAELHSVTRGKGRKCAST